MWPVFSHYFVCGKRYRWERVQFGWSFPKNPTAYIWHRKSFSLPCIYAVCSCHGALRWGEMWNDLYKLSVYNLKNGKSISGKCREINTNLFFYKTGLIGCIFIHLLSSRASSCLLFQYLTAHSPHTHTHTFFIFLICWHQKNPLTMGENSLAVLSLCSCPSRHIFGALHKTHFGTNLVEPEKTVSQRLFSSVFLSYQSLPPLLCQSDPPLFISLFLGPLFTEQWRQSGIPWGQRRASLNIKSPQWTPRQTPRSSIPWPPLSICL